MTVAERFIPCPSRPAARVGSGRYLQIVPPETLTECPAPDHHYVLRPQAASWELVADSDLAAVVEEYFAAHPGGLCRCPAPLAERLQSAVTNPPLRARIRRVGFADLIPV